MTLLLPYGLTAVRPTFTMSSLALSLSHAHIKKHSHTNTHTHTHSALMMLLLPHGLTAVISAFTVSSLVEARRDSLGLQSMKALEVMGRVTTMCIDKNSLLSSGPKRLAMAHICGVPFNGFAEESDSTEAATDNSGSGGMSNFGGDDSLPPTQPNSCDSNGLLSVFTFSTPTRISADGVGSSSRTRDDAPAAISITRPPSITEVARGGGQGGGGGGGGGECSNASVSALSAASPSYSTGRSLCQFFSFSCRYGFF